MNKSIIKDIFYGERGHYETIKESKEYWNLMEKTTKLSEELETGFTGKQKELFENLDTLEGLLESEVALRYFTEGFKAGLLIGIECMDD